MLTEFYICKMKIWEKLRLQEIGVLIYRLGLAFVFYQILRVFFYLYQKEYFQIKGLGDYLNLAWYGLVFDTAAVLYTNALFILLSLVPLKINSKRKYQNVLFWVYIISNSTGLVMNLIDMIYFPFSRGRLTMAAYDVAKNEKNWLKISWEVVMAQYTVIFLGIIILVLWINLYKLVKVKDANTRWSLGYFGISILWLCITAFLAVGGIRGGYAHSTRPINIVDATRHVKNPQLGNVILNSTFSFWRTIDTNSIKEVSFYSDEEVDNLVEHTRQYPPLSTSHPNVVLFIMESFGREYIGSFNKDKNIPGYVSYTPFLDSLAQHSLIFPNAYANGRQSIHGMSSVIAGIPSLVDAFTSSPYANQKIQSAVSIGNEMGYSTSFFHGAPNGSMGFLGYANILGIQKYVGKNEYPNEKDYDGIWGIWDEPLFQFFASELNKEKQPFFSTLFSVSSHHPFKIPEQYKNKIPKGPLEIHQPIGYSDLALKKFFATASQMPWYNNTVFIITADHVNQSFYKEYQKAQNGFAVPILLFSPNPKLISPKTDKRLAQQMDIYPSIAQIMGYKKPFRSWGNSLLEKPNPEAQIMSSDGVQTRMMYGNYIYLFDGKSVTAIYSISDLGFEKNLILNKTPEMEIGSKKIKAWYQDYMNSIVRKKLGSA